MKKNAVFLGMVILISSFLFFSSCKTAEEEYDIRGAWNHVTTIYATETGIITISGSTTESGNCTESSAPMSGTWTQTGTNVVLTMQYGGIIYTWNLTIQNSNLMSGTIQASVLPGVTGTSTLTR